MDAPTRRARRTVAPPSLGAERLTSHRAAHSGEMLVTRRPGCWTRPTGVEPANGSKPASAPSQTTTAPTPFPAIDGVGASAERRQTTSPPLATCCWPRASTHGRPSSVRNRIKAANRGRQPGQPRHRGGSRRLRVRDLGNNGGRDSPALPIPAAQAARPPARCWTVRSMHCAPPATLRHLSTWKRATSAHDASMSTTGRGTTKPRASATGMARASSNRATSRTSCHGAEGYGATARTRAGRRRACTRVAVIDP
jgi:hypothetical protein